NRSRPVDRSANPSKSKRVGFRKLKRGPGSHHDEASSTPTAEQLFAEFRSLVSIHLKQILKLDRKPPIFAVALLVAVACEQISRLFPSAGSADEVFSKAIIEPHGVSARVGHDLFDVMRNGFAHSYYPKMVVIDE